MPYYNPISFNEANPGLVGAERGSQLLQNYMMFPQQLQQAQLENAIRQVQSKYAEPLTQQQLQQSQLDNIIKQAQAKYAEPAAQQDLQKAILYNKYYGPSAEAQMRLQGAQTGLAGSEAEKNRYMLSHPGYFGGEETKTIQALKDLGILKNNQINAATQNQSADQSNQSAGTSPLGTPFNTGNPMIDAILNKPFANSAYQQKMAQGFNWVHSPIDAKNYQIAQLSGMGIDPSESINLLTNGKTVPEIAQERGFDPKNLPEPDYLPTRGNVQQLNQRKSAMAAVSTLGNYVQQGLGPYARTIMNYSPKQISDAVTGMNRDQQVKFLAARGIVPELTTMRLASAGGKVTVHAIEAMQDASLSNIKILKSLVPNDVWIDAQKEIDSQINNAMNASNNAYTVGKRSQKLDRLEIR